MTLGPDDLPPPDSQHARLYCHCTSDLFACYIKDGKATLKCEGCKGTVAVLDTGELATIPPRSVDPARDTLQAGLGDSGQASGQLAQIPPPQRNGAVLRGGDADGLDVPILADVDEFIYGRPGAGFAGMASGAAWGEEARDKMNLGQVYRDTGDRDHRGVRIFGITR